MSSLILYQQSEVHPVAHLVLYTFVFIRKRISVFQIRFNHKNEYTYPSQGLQL
jgi:hypothetical protein